jgi:PQQ-dependent catabolism-associated CXXCW motif protein
MPPAHQSLPSAVWLVDLGRGKVKSSQDKWYKARLVELTQGNKSRPLVVYCHPQCWAGWNAAKRLITYGYREVYWYPEGIEGWQLARLGTAPAIPILPPP